MSEQNEPIEFDYTREEIRDVFGLTDTDLRNFSKREWEENSVSVLDTIRSKIEANERYISPEANILINNKEQLDDLANFLSRLVNEEDLRHSFLVYPEHPYEHTTALGAQGTAAAQAQAEAQNAQQLPPPPVNNQAISNNDLPIYVGGTYQYDKFKEDFYDKLTPEQKANCKEGHYKSLADLKADTGMWNAMDQEQQKHYENLKDYPVGIFLMKSSDPVLQQKFSAAADKVSNMEVPRESIGEKISNAFRPGR